MENFMKLAKLWLLCVLTSAVFGWTSLTTAIANDQQFSSAYQPYVEQGDMPGAVLIVATPTEIVSEETVGWADVAQRTPIRTDSVFWIASNSKAIVAAAVMICVEEGKLDLDAPIENYLPQLKDLKIARPQEDGSVLLTPVSKKPTLRQALSHTAGFRFITPLQERYGIDVLQVQRLASLVGVTPLIDEPGARYSYSNLGIDMGQAAVEAVVGKPFEEFLQERILDPLEMNETTFFPNDELRARFVTPYAWDREKNALKPIRFLQNPSIDDGSPRYAEGGGGLFSTPRDLIKFFQMLGGKGVGANGVRILSEESVATIASKQTGDALADNYGFGVVVNDVWYGHGGAYGTQGVVYRDGGLAAVYMVAVSGLPKQGEAERVFRNRLDEIARERAGK